MDRAKLNFGVGITLGYATLGEISSAMKDIFGEHKEPVAL